MMLLEVPRANCSNPNPTGLSANTINTEVDWQTGIDLGPDAGHKGSQGVTVHPPLNCDHGTFQGIADETIACHKFQGFGHKAR